MSQATYVTRSFRLKEGRWILQSYSTQKYSDLVGFWPVAEKKLESDWITPAGTLRYKVELPSQCPDCTGSATCSTCLGEGIVLEDPNKKGEWLPLSVSKEQWMNEDISAQIEQQKKQRYNNRINK